MISCFPTDHEWTDEGLLCIIQQPRQSCGGSPVVVKPGTVILLCLIDVCECLCLFICVFEIPKCILNCQYTHCMLRDQVLRSFNFLLTKRPWSDEETRVLWRRRQSCGGAPVVVKPGMVILLCLIDVCECLCLFICVFEIPKCVLNCQYTHCMLRDQVLRSLIFCWPRDHEVMKKLMYCGDIDSLVVEHQWLLNQVWWCSYTWLICVHACVRAPPTPGGYSHILATVYGYVPLERVWFSSHLVWYRV